MNVYRRKVILQILAPTIASVILLYLGYYLSISNVKEILLDEKKNQVKEMVYSIYNMVEGYYIQVEQGKISKEEAQTIIKFNIENLRYGTSSKDYYWIINYDNSIIAHPFFNTDDENQIDSTSDLFISLTELASLAKEKGEGYLEYKWQWKDDESRIESKISFTKRFEPWEWVMGTGFYVDEVDAKIKKMTRYIFFIMTLLIFLTSSLYLLIVKKTFHNLKLYFEKKDELDQNITLFRGLVINLGLIIKKEDNVIFSNKKAQEILETTIKEGQEFRLFDYVVTEEQERIHSLFNKDKKEGMDINFWILTKKNNKKHIHVNLAFNYLKDDSYTYMLINDDTEKKEIENQIKILSQTVEQSPDSMAITDLNGNIIYVNKKFSEETGYSYEEVIGKNPNIIKKLSKF